MTKWFRQILLGVVLVGCSLAFYGLHYFIFRDLHHILIYLIGDIAFVFIEVLLVSVIIHRLLGEHEKQARLEKLNMIIGVFFSEVGVKLLEFLSIRDPQVQTIQNSLNGDKGFSQMCGLLKKHSYDFDPEGMDWEAAKELLSGKRDFLVRLLENSSLHEHESFTDVLRAVFHLAEELGARESLHNLSDADRDHLAGDVKRVYGQLTLQWINYMKHLERSYPYLFSLSQRMNPFDRAATPVVQAE